MAIAICAHSNLWCLGIMDTAVCAAFLAPQTPVTI